MAEWTEGDVPVNGTNIHYYRMGLGGKPPVVLLHGFTDNGLCWMRLATDLAPGYDLVMIDAVGHGKSGGPEHGFRARAVSDVLAVIEALGLERPALVGHSMGAGTAAGVAAEAGDRIRAIALEDPGWRDTPPPPIAENTASAGEGSRAPLGGPAWAEWNRKFKELSPDERYAQAAVERAAWPEIDRTFWADAKAQLNLDVLKEQNPARPPWRDTVRRITCPILLITADTERGAIVTPAMAEEVQGLWRTGKMVHIPGAGHNIRREQYAPYRVAVTTFLAETAG
ncbi:MAG: alpha/beta hydrolase [Thermomicrobia bacterium]|nr:alpha/beta hydrolase [Thermomicrobia bacterium]MCA1722992.1 alpha/beta hydrolase [Thermomicrobia bacterium]